MEVARRCLATSSYERGADRSQWPHVLDCSSFICWVYAQCGIYLPRRSIQQRDCGHEVDLNSVRAGDLIFCKGPKINYYREDATDSVGHVGMVSDTQTILHASSGRNSIVEDSLALFLTNHPESEVRRLVDDFSRLHTFKVPEGVHVDSSDDLLWIILQNLAVLQKTSAAV